MIIAVQVRYSVEAGVLAWAMSAVAQLAETEAGTDETARQLRLPDDDPLCVALGLSDTHDTPMPAMQAPAPVTWQSEPLRPPRAGPRRHLVDQHLEPGRVEA